MVLWQGREEAYGLLAKLLAAEYGLPQLPELARQEGGKPFFPQRPDLHFNVSHSGGLALCGAGSAPLGVDIEEVRPRRSGLARYICSPAEYAWYEELGGDWESLYTIWTLIDLPRLRRSRVAGSRLLHASGEPAGGRGNAL